LLCFLRSALTRHRRVAGYTAANFSGRMPLPDLADAIVSSGRDTLLRAIALVHANPAWGAKARRGCCMMRAESELSDSG
jgi:hypothetical protein